MAHSISERVRYLGFRGRQCLEYTKNTWIVDKKTSDRTNCKGQLVLTVHANIWQVIPVERFQKLVECMPRSVAAVIKGRGSTRYLSLIIRVHSSVVVANATCQKLSERGPQNSSWEGVRSTPVVGLGLELHTGESYATFFCNTFFLNCYITNLSDDLEDDIMWENGDTVTNSELTCEDRSEESFSKLDTIGEKIPSHCRNLYKMTDCVSASLNRRERERETDLPVYVKKANIYLERSGIFFILAPITEEERDLNLLPFHQKPCVLPMRPVE
ncbi:hypothetical protein TNCV_3544421 [Trichonephila clavipes]|nr:hypothetical protein TNCV_3544421 [Trichonephila clavipes]